MRLIGEKRNERGPRAENEKKEGCGKNPKRNSDKVLKRWTVYIPNNLYICPPAT